MNNISIDQIREAIKAGYEAYIIINGERYTIKDDESKKEEPVTMTTPYQTANLIDKLFYAMRADIETMSEYGDNEHALLHELLTADEEILKAYEETFL